jgi:hypothetical protein
MRYIAFLFFLFVVVAQAEIGAGYWTGKWETKLYKDEVQEVYVSDYGVEKLLQFRWTLFANDNLIVHANYNGFISQQVLSQKNKRLSFKLIVSPKNVRYQPAPYMLIKFLEFDHKNKMAHFGVYFKNYGPAAEVEFVKKDREIVKEEEGF